MAEITFKLAVVTSSVAKITFVVDEITFIVVAIGHFVFCHFLIFFSYNIISFFITHNLILLHVDYFNAELSKMHKITNITSGGGGSCAY